MPLRSFIQSTRLLTTIVKPEMFFFKPATSDQYGGIVAHLQKYFSADEPLSKAMQLASVNGNPDMEDYIVSTLDERLSFVAVTEDDKIAGVMLNGYFVKGDEKHFDEKVESCRTETFKKIYRILLDVNVPVNLCSMYSVDRIFEARIASVDPKYRDHKLGWQLLKRSEILAKDVYSYKISKVEATSLFSQKILSKLGYKSFNKIFYDKYVDSFGKPIFNVELPHKSVQLMVKVLS